MNTPQHTLSDTSGLPSNGSAKAVSLSSNATLFWRVFVTVFSTVIVSGFFIALWLIDEDDLYLPFPALWMRLGMTAIWLLWLWMLRQTLWKLLRIDSDGNHLFVTNYWNTVRYPWSDVVRCTESRHLGRRVVHIHLRAPGRFGQKISFLPAKHYDNWMQEHGFDALVAN